MNKFVILIMGLFFATRLFASIAPHVAQLEHDAPVLIRSALIVSVVGYLAWSIIKYLKKNTKSRRN